jgi:uncharacterized membrane protein HdeD (DUF308 family)
MPLECKWLPHAKGDLQNESGEALFSTSVNPKGSYGMSESARNVSEEFLGAAKKNSGLTIAMGVILLLMGILAIGSPFIAGVSVVLTVGVAFLIGGIGQLVFSIKARAGIFSLIIGVLTVIVGGYMLANPGAALASLTLFLAAYFIVSGIFEALLAFKARPVSGWGWSLFSGIVSVILGAMIWSQFPVSGAWAIGILLGVRLVLGGWTLIMFGSVGRGAAKELART